MDSKDLGRRSFLVSGAAVAAAALLPSRLVGSAHAALPWFRSLQYIAALGDPHATSGATAQTWGLWRQDPGPRGVSLARYESLKAKGVASPADIRGRLRLPASDRERAGEGAEAST